MQIARFIIVGENIHCTRVFKVNGKFVRPMADGGHAIAYKAGDQERLLPVPDVFTGSADWESGKVKHCAVAIWQGNYGDDAGKEAGVDYLQSQARRQESAGATYLDINVDEFSTDVEERVQLMKWTVAVVQDAAAIPVSIDSSNVDILRSGLAACDKSRGRPMVNSVSLERVDAIDVAAEFDAVVIASAAGERDLPSSTEEKLTNIDALMTKLDAAGFDDMRIHIDPLVFPISTDGANGQNFLDAVAAIRESRGADIHIVAGLSNISFGMPKRKLINQVFTYLAVQAGADGGIVDPLQINTSVLESLDPDSESFGMARDLLQGSDEFGMNYITACREGKI